MNIFIALFFGALLVLGLGGGFLLWSGQMARDEDAREFDGEPTAAPSPPTLAPVPDPRPLPGPGTR